MKRFLGILTAFLALGMTVLLMLSARQRPGAESRIQEESNARVGLESILEQETPLGQETAPEQKSIPERGTAPEDAAGEHAAEVSAESVPEVSVEEANAFPLLSETGYAWSQLSAEEQTLYLEIYHALTECKEDAPVSTLNGEEIRRIFDCVLEDHPEIFYVDGFTYTTHALGEEVCEITFSGNYILDQKEIAERQAGIEEIVQPLLASVMEEPDDYARLKRLYDYVVTNTRYNLEAKENQTICSVFLYGESVCQGYARAFQYLCLRAGIPCVLAAGTVQGGVGHAWNVVNSDGVWYCADPTWGDADYRLEGSGGQEPKRPAVNYDYFMVTDEQLERTHTPDGLFELPVCASITDNYYVRENAWFETADMEAVAALFEESYASGKEMVTLKCASQEVYGELERLLLEEQGIFDLLKQHDGEAAYVLSPELLTIGFWL